MIYQDNHNVSGVFAAGKSIKAIYKGSLLLWEAIESCFGKGFWIGEKPWSNEDAWKNN